jgi:hypothetical protein
LPDEVIVTMGLHRIGDLAGLGPALGFGLLGDLSRFGQLWADLGDSFGEALFT